MDIYMDKGTIIKKLAFVQLWVKFIGSTVVATFRTVLEVLGKRKNKFHTRLF
jgi:hypothetical protein